MMCFRDMTFCSAPCAASGCDRKLTDRVKDDADKWWGQPGAPIASANLSAGCDRLLSVNPQAQVGEQTQ